MIRGRVQGKGLQDGKTIPVFGKIVSGILLKCEKEPQVKILVGAGFSSKCPRTTRAILPWDILGTKTSENLKAS